MQYVRSVLHNHNVGRIPFLTNSNRSKHWAFWNFGSIWVESAGYFWAHVLLTWILWWDWYGLQNQGQTMTNTYPPNYVWFITFPWNMEYLSVYIWSSYGLHTYMYTTTYMYMFLYVASIYHTQMLHVWHIHQHLGAAIGAASYRGQRPRSPKDCGLACFFMISNVFLSLWSCDIVLENHDLYFVLCGNATSNSYVKHYRRVYPIHNP